MPTTAEQRDLDDRLIAAAKDGSTGLTSELLDQGANPNACDEWGYTPLRHASRYNYACLAGLLIDAGADPNLYGAYQTLLIVASVYGSIDVIERLLQAGANPNQTNGAGNTALMVAVAQDDCPLAVVCLLLAAGARTDIVNTSNQMALHIATKIPMDDPDIENKIAKRLDVDPELEGEYEGIIKLLTTPPPATWLRRKFKVRRPDALAHSKLHKELTLFESYQINGHYMPLATDLNRWTRETILITMLVIMRLRRNPSQLLPELPLEMWLNVLSRVHSVQIESYQPESRRWVPEKERNTPTRQVAIAFHGR